MADRSSVYIFGKIFDYLGHGTPDKRALKLAKELSELRRDFDFEEYQMDCKPGVLEKLGIKEPEDD